MDNNEAAILASILDGKIEWATVVRIATRLDCPRFATEIQRRKDPPRRTVAERVAPLRYAGHRIGT